MYLCVRNAPAFHSTVLYVGFQSLVDNVTEGAGHELACVEVMVTVPLLLHLFFLAQKLLFPVIL